MQTNSNVTLCHGWKRTWKLRFVTISLMMDLIHARRVGGGSSLQGRVPSNSPEPQRLDNNDQQDNKTPEEEEEESFGTLPFNFLTTALFVIVGLAVGLVLVMALFHLSRLYHHKEQPTNNKKDQDTPSTTMSTTNRDRKTNVSMPASGPHRPKCTKSDPSCPTIIPPAPFRPSAIPRNEGEDDHSSTGNNDEEKSKTDHGPSSSMRSADNGTSIEENV